jgi:hypothetical protein
MAKSFTFDSVDMADYDLQVVDYDIPEMAGIDFNMHSPIMGDASFTSLNHTIRTITIECAITGTSVADMQSNLDSVKSALNPILTDKILSIDGVADRQFVGRVSGISAPSVKGKSIKVFEVTFQCLAEQFGTAETESSTAIATDPDTLTISAVLGNVHRQPCALYVRNTTGGTLTGQTVSVENETTNETLVAEVTLQNGYWLQIGEIAANGTFGAVLKLSTGSGADPDALSYVDVMSMYESGDWPRLKGGVDNDITVIGISTGTLLWKYRARYL